MPQNVHFYIEVVTMATREHINKAAIFSLMELRLQKWIDTL